MSAPSLAPPPSPPSRSSGAATIVARGLAKSFRGQRAVVPFDLDLGPGGIAGLLGPNGSGKSTFLRMLIGLVPRDAGSAVVGGVELAGDGTAVRRRVSYAPGEIALYRELTGEQHLAWFLEGRAADGRVARERARAFAERLGLPLGKSVRAYSHGMKRQLVLCAALAPDVPVRILDEPTEGLDPTKRGEVLELLRADAAAGRTILLSSHHLGEVDRVCDRLVFLNRGEKIADERASAVEARARGLLRLGFGSGADVARLAERATAFGARNARVDGDRLLLEIDGEDPRPFLARAFAEPGFAAPRAIEFGRMSLAELYRDLYGVEGC